ncbi:MAG: hypothetical protein CSA62_11670 [Planctomycetota bacterium]|nr:MAG: hypothetical protein CSA62_11670 [Planctomycetota bacterium]
MLGGFGRAFLATESGPRLSNDQRLTLYGGIAYGVACSFPWLGPEHGPQLHGFAQEPLVLVGHAIVGSIVLVQLASFLGLGAAHCASLVRGLRPGLVLTVIGLVSVWARPEPLAFGLILASIGLAILANGVMRLSRAADGSASDEGSR